MDLVGSFVGADGLKIVCVAHRGVIKGNSVWIRSAFDTPAAAFERAQELVEEWSPSNHPDALSVIGEFVVPPPDGEATRDFQTLHFDFGLPVHPQRNQDVARYTALLIPRSVCGVTAVTRLVSLRGLLGQRGWPERATLLGNLISYGESHGAWDEADGYSEGSLARLVEAAAGSPRLPSVKSTPGFLRRVMAARIWSGFGVAAVTTICMRSNQR